MSPHPPTCSHVLLKNKTHLLHLLYNNRKFATRNLLFEVISNAENINILMYLKSMRHMFFAFSILLQFAQMWSVYCYAWLWNIIFLIFYPHILSSRRIMFIIHYLSHFVLAVHGTIRRILYCTRSVLQTVYH